jgi:hypothetical protein
MSSGRNKGCNEAEDGAAVTSRVVAAVIVDGIPLGIGEKIAVGGDEGIVSQLLNMKLLILIYIDIYNIRS